MEEGLDRYLIDAVMMKSELDFFVIQNAQTIIRLHPKDTALSLRDGPSIATRYVLWVSRTLVLRADEA